MEKKRIKLSMLDTQTDRDGGRRQIQILTDGQIYRDQDAWFLEFDETDDMGCDHVHTQIIARDNEITLLKRGGEDARFVFRKDQKFISTYHILNGSIEMSVYPLLVSYQIEESRGALDLKYQLNIEGEFASVNSLSVSFSNAT